MAYPEKSSHEVPVGRAYVRTTEAYVGMIDVVPSDDNDLAFPVTALIASSDGTIKVTLVDGSIGSLPVVAGTVYHVVTSRVWDTGTTATGIKGLY
jgi:hypothetical protein